MILSGIGAAFLVVSLSRASEAPSLTKVTLKDSGFRYEAPFWIISEYPPSKKIDASKEKLVWDGMTVGDLVAALGKGWEARWDNVGTVSWPFDDGSWLSVSLGESLKADTILTSNRTERGAKMQWRRD